MEHLSVKHCHACGHYLSDKLKRVASDDNRWLLYQNDFRDLDSVIKDGSIDVVISDPPYGSGGFTVKDVTRSSKSKYVSSDSSYQDTLPNIDGDSLHPMAWRQLMTDACIMAKRVLTDRGLLVLFIDWRNLPALQEIIHSTGFTLRGTVVWNKGNGVRPIKNGFKSQSEFILWATKGKMPVRDTPVYLPGVLTHATMTNGKVHITQKPESLMLDLVKICPDGGTVFDFFMGSGTTGVAALKSGLNFVGCESVEQYFETSCRRCKAVLG
jgi:site-specific DNA-methyltransferase (adenine-specific)